MEEMTIIERVGISIGWVILGSGFLLWTVRKKRYRGKNAIPRKIGDILVSLVLMGAGIFILIHNGPLIHNGSPSKFVMTKDWRFLALAIVEGIVALWVISKVIFYKK